MVARAGMPSIAARAPLALALLAALGGCGSAAPPRAHAGGILGRDASTPTTRASCAATVLDTLGRVAKHIYHEGISSERTQAALRSVETSAPLRLAVERHDPLATRSAAEALVSGGRMTNLRVTSAGTVLADVGSPQAVTPLKGTLRDATGTPIASFQTTVWADDGIVAETNGLAQAATLLRTRGHTVAGRFELGASEPPPRGRIVVGGVPYQYTSFHVVRFPSGPLREYVIRTLASTAPLCGRSEQDTVVHTLSRVAMLIYEGEAGRRTLSQVRRVEADPALLSAVAAHDPAATRAAIVRLLNQHIVRLRVRDTAGMLVDVGGPDVLAPVPGTLTAGGHRIGSFILSIQDDEGYLRLTRRLVGLRVLMSAGSQLVKNDLGPSPEGVPSSGHYTYRGQEYRVFTFTARAFPSGPLAIAVLIPIPYG